jgi:hypothetical protein
MSVGEAVHQRDHYSSIGFTFLPGTKPETVVSASAAAGIGAASLLP